MLPLAARLRARGLRPQFFGYTAMFESFTGCTGRLAAGLRACARDGPYVAVAHSLGGVLLRAALDSVASPPERCFLLATPNIAPRAAQFFQDGEAYRFFTGEIGQLLADSAFMASLPVPPVPTRVYSGTAGPRSAKLPLGLEPNDGLITVTETVLSPFQPITLLPALHTFIMNSRRVADDIVAASAELIATPRAAP